MAVKWRSLSSRWRLDLYFYGATLSNVGQAPGQNGLISSSGSRRPLNGKHDLHKAKSQGNKTARNPHFDQTFTSTFVTQ